MGLDQIIALAVSLLLLAYLITAMLKPENL